MNKPRGDDTEAQYQRGKSGCQDNRQEVVAYHTVIVAPDLSTIKVRLLP